MFNNVHPDLKLKTNYEMAPLPDSCVTYTSSGISSVTSPGQISPFLAGAAAYTPLPKFSHFIPADPTSWTGEMIPGLNSLPGFQADPMVAPPSDGWYGCQPPPPLVAFSATNQEAIGIELVHALLDCAGSIQCENLVNAGSILEKIEALLTLVSGSFGIGKVAGYFVQALSRRIYPAQGVGIFPENDELFYRCFYEVAPYLKFAHFTANQAILEAINGRDCVHIIDFGLMQGLQWPALIQALALRPGGPPSLKITGVGPRSISLNQVGTKLAEMAGSVNVKFEFRAVAVSRLDEIKPDMLDIGSDEAVAVNFVFQLHKLLGSDPVNGRSLKAVLSWVRGLNPTVVTVVEQEADHNQLGFLDRFRGALYYYSTIFDSLAAYPAHLDKSCAEMYVQREMVDIVCFEGSARLERHEPLTKWKARLSEAGFKAVDTGLKAFTQASMLLTLFSANGYCVQEIEGFLTLGWHGLPLIAASVWQPDDDVSMYFDNI